MLRIQAEGEEYEARTEIRRSMTIDSLGQVYREKDGDSAGYRQIYYSRELPGQGDYMRFKR